MGCVIFGSVLCSLTSAQLTLRPLRTHSGRATPWKRAGAPRIARRSTCPPRSSRRAAPTVPAHPGALAHGNPARPHTCTTRTPQTPPVYTGKHSQHAQTTAQDTSRPKKRAAPLKNGKHAAPKPPARAARCRLVARARHAPGHGPIGAMSRLRGGAPLQVRPALTRRRGGHCPPDERSPGSCPRRGGFPNVAHATAVASAPLPLPVSQ